MSSVTDSDDVKKDTRILCQFGDKCYRKNPFHLSKYKHPSTKKESFKKKETEEVVTGTKRKGNDTDNSNGEAKSDYPKAKALKTDSNSSDINTYNFSIASECDFSTDKNSDNIKTDTDDATSPKLGTVSDDAFSKLGIKENETSSKLGAEEDVISSKLNATGDAAFLELGAEDNEASSKLGTENDTVSSKLDTGSDEASLKFNVNDDRNESLTMHDLPAKEDSNKIHQIDPNPTAMSAAITELFLTVMPEDFYQFHTFCQSIAKDNPSAALKHVKLQLVGPYDVLTRKLSSYSSDDKEKYLRHWRYYYDPPEFQTVIKCENKDGLHFGYWRDNVSEKPVFVARNNVNVNCIIEPVASNIFGAVSFYVEDQIKSANPFEKTNIANFHRKLKQFVNENDILLEKSNSNMRKRERSVVARTFHKAGIVVPYDKKTQVGYRELTATDSELRKIMKSVEEAATAEKKKEALSKLEEIMRLATIAADECDFGTCLELAHDLFAGGVAHLQNMALQMFSVAYTHLERPELLRIVKSHFQDRRRGSNLSVL